MLYNLKVPFQKAWDATFPVEYESEKDGRNYFMSPKLQVCTTFWYLSGFNYFCIRDSLETT